MKRIWSNSLFIGIVNLGLCSGMASAVSLEALQQGIPTLAPMLESVTPAVVNIRVTKAIPTSNQYLFEGDRIPEELRKYFENVPRSQRRQPFAMGAGSGVIVDSEAGFIVTNHHVIDDAANITVQLNDGRVLEAQLIGSDANTDVALLKVEAEDLVEIELADIDSVHVGDFVVAIGNPFGIGQTVTSGIVSALGRNGLNTDNYEDFIQTDAAINVGNSGGALVDLEGRLIGVNTAIISGNGGGNGIGFAVPADMVGTVIGHLERDGEVRRGMLGVTVSSVTPEVREALAMTVEQGAVVTSVLPGSAAEQAGLEISDVIVEIDGEAVTSSRELRNIIGLLRRNQDVSLRLYRNGEAMTVSAVIGDQEGAAAIAGGAPANSGRFRGADLRNIEPDDEITLEAGVMVNEVDPSSRSWAAGLRPGDVIVEVNRQPVSELDDFNGAIADSSRFTAITAEREDRRVLLLVP